MDYLGIYFPLIPCIYDRKFHLKAYTLPTVIFRRVLINNLILKFTPFNILSFI